MVTAIITVGKTPRFLTAGEGLVWTFNQGDGTVARVDAKTGKIIATIDCGVAGPRGDIVSGEGSVWVTMPHVPLTRIDPKPTELCGHASMAGLLSALPAVSNPRGATVWPVFGNTDEIEAVGNGGQLCQSGWSKGSGNHCGRLLDESMPGSLTHFHRPPGSLAPAQETLCKSVMTAH